MRNVLQNTHESVIRTMEKLCLLGLCVIDDRRQLYSELGLPRILRGSLNTSQRPDHAIRHEA